MIFSFNYLYTVFLKYFLDFVNVTQDVFILEIISIHHTSE